ncbi:MAG: DNA-directed RNA polymerase subunit alpha [Lachnospiraceae bacterium]|nr:DNA-directed RNA polymerase subunit alpha [Lachnospiraceae bacterium]
MLALDNCPNVKVAEISADKKYGRFVISPLSHGYGITLGNALRRIMLASTPGAAVSQIKIDGVLHEFTTIPGVKEDVTEIILNIKKLAICDNSGNTDPKKAHIAFEGNGEVTAKDIRFEDPDVVIINKDQTIATLSGGKESRLDMSLVVTSGRGYVSSDKNKKNDCPIGSIAVDSLYTPVTRVNMTVEEKDDSTDELTLDVYTNGALAPDVAVALAAKVLSEHLLLFVNLSETANKAKEAAQLSEKASEVSANVRIEELDLSQRPYNALKRTGIDMVSQLTEMTAADVKKIRNLGASSYDEIVAKLVEHGFSLKSEV